MVTPSREGANTTGLAYFWFSHILIELHWLKCLTAHHYMVGLSSGIIFIACFVHVYNVIGNINRDLHCTL